MAFHHAHPSSPQTIAIFFFNLLFFFIFCINRSNSSSVQRRHLPALEDPAKSVTFPTAWNQTPPTKVSSVLFLILTVRWSVRWLMRWNITQTDFKRSIILYSFFFKTFFFRQWVESFGYLFCHFLTQIWFYSLPFFFFFQRLVWFLKYLVTRRFSLLWEISYFLAFQKVVWTKIVNHIEFRWNLKAWWWVSRSTQFSSRNKSRKWFGDSKIGSP